MLKIREKLLKIMTTSLVVLLLILMSFYMVGCGDISGSELTPEEAFENLMNVDEDEKTRKDKLLSSYEDYMFLTFENYKNENTVKEIITIDRTPGEYKIYRETLDVNTNVIIYELLLETEDSTKYFVTKNEEKVPAIVMDKTVIAEEMNSLLNHFFNEDILPASVDEIIAAERIAILKESFRKSSLDITFKKPDSELIQEVIYTFTMNRIQYIKNYGTKEDGTLFIKDEIRYFYQDDFVQDMELFDTEKVIKFEGVEFNESGEFEISEWILLDETIGIDCIAVNGDDVTLEINGGYYDGGQTPVDGLGNTAVFLNNASSKVIINDGYFSISGLAEGGTGHIDLIYCKYGTIEINGGYFEGEDNTVWLLNCKDSSFVDGTAKIIVKGGTYKNFDPSNVVNEVGGPVSYVAEGYIVTATEADENGDIYYTVIAE